MVSDPYQTTNISDAHPAVVQKMDLLLTEWLHQQQVKPYAIPDSMQAELHERQNRRS
jgi:hypothetical protein